MKIKAISLFILSIFTIFSMDAQTKPSVNELDLKRYMGLWYEIARFDNWFEKDLVAVTARYTLKPDGNIEVLNSGRVKTPDGKLKASKGKAKQPDPMNPRELKVSFFLWFYSDYNILMLGPDYEYALIGSNSDKYLWILSRTPKIEKKTLTRILDYAESLGYNVSKLYFTPQP
ncbi:MAG: lipocalin family protein [Bacteroidales bacterium]